MPPQQKKFVKYQFDDPGPKPREQRRQSRQNFKQRDSNTQTRNKRHVSYTEKSTSARQNVLRDMISSFIPIKKASSKITQLMKTFPKFFSQIPRQPQPFTPQSLNGHLAFMGKKILQRQARQFAQIEHQSESDPNWDSDSDVDGKIQSKKIDQSVVEKVKQKLSNLKQLRQDELKRHEKQFLEDYYRQKHQQELQNNQKNENKDEQNPNSTNSLPTSQPSPDNQWTQYQQKQVTQFVNMGFIQKIQQDQNDFSADDFSVEDQKSEDSKSEKSNSSDGDDDDIFGDQGPTRIVKVKAEADEPLQQKMGKVVINNHLFSRIAQCVGIPPGACIWIIRNKTQRYKVSTQFMDEMYRLNNFCQSLPYVSLNHSQFVHNNDVEKEKGLQIFKKFNARKHQTGHNQGNSHHKISSRTYQNKRKFQQYKPNPQQPTSKTHINKK